MLGGISFRGDGCSRVAFCCVGGGGWKVGGESETGKSCRILNGVTAESFCANAAVQPHAMTGMREEEDETHTQIQTEVKKKPGGDRDRRRDLETVCVCV